MSTNYELLTCQDVIEHLIDVFNLQGSVRDERLVRRAITEAINDIAARPWSRYQRSFRITTSASQNSGSVTYVSSTRLLTLASATWPDDAIFGEVEIGGVLYKPETRVSSTVLLMRSDQCPSADLSTATSYIWQRDTYPLPDDFGVIGQIVNLQSKRSLSRWDFDALLAHKRQSLERGDPRAYVIVGLREFGGGLGIQFAPVPTTARNLDATYQASPRTPRTKAENTGTIDCTSGSTTITGTGTAFASIHVGSVLRLSADSLDYPTNFSGYSGDKQNPWVEQMVIKSVASATSLVTEQAPSQSLTGVKFTISDPIDMDYGAMLTYFLRLAEARYCRLLARPDRGEREGAADRAFVDACVADRKSNNSSTPPRGETGLLRDMATSYNFG